MSTTEPEAPHAPTESRPIEPLDPPMIGFAIGGIAAWAIAGLILLAIRPTLVAHGHGNWLWICVAGFLVGFPGLVVMIRHDANRRRRRASQST